MLCRGAAGGVEAILAKETGFVCAEIQDVPIGEASASMNGR